MEKQDKKTKLDGVEQDDENVADFFSETIERISRLREREEVAGFAAEDYLDEAVSALEAARTDVIRG